MQTNSQVEKARRYVESHPKISGNRDNKNLKSSSGPCITISRETGAGADVISEKVAALFNKIKSYNQMPWTIFDRNLIEKVIQDNHLPKSLAGIMEEEKYSEIKSMMIELLGGQPPIFNLIHKTTQTILQLAEIGNVIILDRGSNIITYNLQNSFHVRLVAPIEQKIKHVETLYDFDRHKAIDFIKHEDEDRKDFVSTYFHKDINDPLLYNMVINTGLSSDDETAEIIYSAVLKKFPEYFI